MLVKKTHGYTVTNKKHLSPTPFIGCIILRHFNLFRHSRGGGLPVLGRVHAQRDVLRRPPRHRLPARDHLCSLP